MGRVSPRPPARLAERRRQLLERRARRRRGAAAVLLALAVAVGAGAWHVTSGRGNRPLPSGPARAPTARFAAVHTAARRRATVVRLVASPAGSLPSAVQDEAAAPAGASSALLLGGLTASDLSSADIVRFPAGRVAPGIAAAGAPRHCRGDPGRAARSSSAAATASPSTPRSSASTRTVGTRVAGRLPAPSSDQAAAAVGGTAYVVGGYDGAHWLDTIVAWKPGSPARVVAHLPSALRYAAATAVGNRLVIAGGSRPDGSATDAVLVYTPGGHVVVLGRLPAPTTHAAAATLGSDRVRDRRQGSAARDADLRDRGRRPLPTARYAAPATCPGRSAISPPSAWATASSSPAVAAPPARSRPLTRSGRSP